jgi:hypothetical protein
MASISDHGSLRIILRSNSSSSHGHESPPQEASTLLSPGPLHRDAPVQERDMPAITEDVEEGNETQPSLSSCPAPSNPSSTREEKDARPTSFRRTTHWKTVGMVVGFLFAGQSAHAQERAPLTLRSLSFRPRTLYTVQEIGPRAHRYRPPYPVPSLCRLYPLDNHLQSRADGEYWYLLRTAPVVRPPRKRYVAGHDREIVRFPH